ncbi:MAG: hypothetical protein KA113_07895 [Syntrophaceae bacterium]|nr:hypothetical protein [Syntrophaceae bacterium]
MGMTPDYFFELFVLGNSEDYKENPGCLRRAFNASVAASHLADHYFTYNKLYKPSLVSEFNNMVDYVNYLSRKTSGAFRDIRSIANAYKHLYTDSNPNKINYNTVSSPAVIESIEIHEDDVEINLISAEFAPESTLIEKISFTRIDGSKSDFLPILNTVVDYWKSVI